MADSLIFNNLDFITLQTEGGLVFRNLPDSTGAERPDRVPLGSQLSSDEIDDNFRKLRDAGVNLENALNDLRQEFDEVNEEFLPGLSQTVIQNTNSITQLQNNTLPSRAGVPSNRALVTTNSQGTINWRRIAELPLNDIVNASNATDNQVLTYSGGSVQWAAVPATIPVGAIMMWGNGAIPTGWAECNGQTVNGFTTPNLSGRFVVGAGTSDVTYNLDQTGGSSEVTLSISQIPAHSHSPGFGENIWREGGGLTWQPGGGGRGIPAPLNLSTVGGGQSHENRPPFYVLRYIVYVGV